MLKRAVHWLLLAVTGFYVLTGFGITQYRAVTAATFGLLGKAASQRLHDALWIPFGFLLILHLVLTLRVRKNRGRGSRDAVSR